MYLLSTSQPRSAMIANTVPFVDFITQENSQALLTKLWQFVSLKCSASQNEEQSMGDSSVQSEDGMIPLLICRISWKPHTHCLSVSSCGAPVFHWYLTTSKLLLASEGLSIDSTDGTLTINIMNVWGKNHNGYYYLVHLADIIMLVHNNYDAGASVASQASGWRWNGLNFYSVFQHCITSVSQRSTKQIVEKLDIRNRIWLVKNIFPR